MTADQTYQEAVRGRLMEILGTTDAEWTDSVIQDAGPMIVCSAVGHEDRPTAFLRRFLSRPWRCNRCKAWFVTVRKFDYNVNNAYTWKYIGLDKDVLQKKTP